MLGGNQTPILNQTFELLKGESFEYTPKMLPNMLESDSQVLTHLGFLKSFVYQVNYKGPMSYWGKIVSNCIVWMMENVGETADKQAILRNMARKKLLIIVGEHDFAPRIENFSPTPIINVNKFGHIRVYCSSLELKFWTSQLFKFEDFILDLESDYCPVKSYVR